MGRDGERRGSRKLWVLWRKSAWKRWELRKARWEWVTAPNSPGAVGVSWALGAERNPQGSRERQRRSSPHSDGTKFILRPPEVQHSEQTQHSGEDLTSCRTSALPQPQRGAGWPWVISGRWEKIRINVPCGEERGQGAPAPRTRPCSGTGPAGAAPG